MSGAPLLVAAGCALTLLAAELDTAYAQAGKLSYPVPHKVEVADDYFGTRVSDPYRWMEDLNSPELAAWVTAENKLTFDYLERLPLREHFRRRITELWNYSRTTVPLIESGRLFYRRNSGLQLQSAIYMRAAPEAPPVLLLDPNVLSPDGSVSLANYAPSPDARLLAYTLSEGGADWQTVHVRDIANARDLPDEIKWMRFSWLSWTRDSKGFFYSRYPEPPRGKVLAAELSGQALYYHRVGTPQSQDVLIYERKDLPTWFIGGWVTEDGRYLMIRMARGAGPRNRLYYADLQDAQRPNVRAAVRPVVEEDEVEHWAFGNIGPVVYLRTDRDASNRKVVAVDLRDPRRVNWKTVVAEDKNPIRSVSLIGGRIVVEYLDNVQSRLALFDAGGRRQGEIALPGRGSIAGIYGREDSPEIYYGYTAPLYPTTVFMHDPRNGKTVPFEPPQATADLSPYESRQFFTVSRDGTRVPFTVTARKDLTRNGENPTLLLGYGGFSISLMPEYRPHIIAWLELGGVWVNANIRGGGEYGAAWHEGARAERRQNGFDDFIAVAEHLVREKYTSPARLGILGGSNGGLLVATVSQQRPDLVAVVLPAVGVLDMLRFDKFTGGRAWIQEYGSSSNPEQFRQLIRYSPLHNIRPGTCYPAAFVTTADHDDRVVPSHSFKFTATLQAAQGCDKPVLIRVEPKASHGYRPTDRQIAEIADQWTFAAEHTGMAGTAGDAAPRQGQ
ncbi:MAG TPA: prolyl oligopeptidase family serine peptidase [Burkholderiales bacterium]|nr:prolyl oligopeptidase family serine peptidase [Burkholderiales bacterium]